MKEPPLIPIITMHLDSQVEVEEQQQSSNKTMISSESPTPTSLDQNIKYQLTQKTQINNPIPKKLQYFKLYLFTSTHFLLYFSIIPVNFTRQLKGNVQTFEEGLASILRHYTCKKNIAQSCTTLCHEISTNLLIYMQPSWTLQYSTLWHGSSLH